MTIPVEYGHGHGGGDPGHLGIVALHVFDEPLGILAAHEGLDRVPEREVGREVDG